MPALSVVLLTFSFQFSLLFCALTQFHIILPNDLAVIWRHYAVSKTCANPCRKCFLVRRV